MPASATHRATPSGPRSIITPSASSTSADPQRDDWARFPCFTTRAPAPAATSAAIVDTLIVPDRSPPVPHVSIAPAATSTSSPYRCIVRTNAASSSTDSPFVRSATIRPAACTSATRPSRISPNAASISSGRSSVPRVTRARIGVNTSFTGTPAPHRQRSSSVPPQVVVEHAPSNKSELHLRGSFDDRQLPCITVVELGEVVLHVAGGSQHLERLARHLHRALARVVLRHREERHEFLRVLALVGHHRSPVRQQPRGLDLGGELGDLPLDALHVGDRPAERRALLHVLDRVHECALGQTDAARRDDWTHRVEPEH